MGTLSGNNRKRFKRLKEMRDDALALAQNVEQAAKVAEVFDRALAKIFEQRNLDFLASIFGSTSGGEVGNATTAFNRLNPAAPADATEIVPIIESLKNQLGETLFRALTEQQQAALVGIIKEAGLDKLPDAIEAIIRTGDERDVAQVIRSLEANTGIPARQVYADAFYAPGANFDPGNNIRTRHELERALEEAGFDADSARQVAERQGELLEDELDKIKEQEDELVQFRKDAAEQIAEFQANLLQEEIDLDKKLREDNIEALKQYEEDAAKQVAEFQGDILEKNAELEKERVEELEQFRKDAAKQVADFQATLLEEEVKKIKEQEEELAQFRKDAAAQLAEFQASLLEDEVKGLETLAERNQKTQDAIKNVNTEIELAKLKNEEREREAFILERINKARADNPDITPAQIALLQERYGILYDLTRLQEEEAGTSSEQLKTARKRLAELRSLATLEKSLHRLRKDQLDAGLFEDAEKTKMEIEALHEEFLKLLDSAVKLVETFDQTDPAIRTITNSLKSAQLSLRPGADAEEPGFAQNLYGDHFKDYEDFAGKYAGGVSESVRNAFDEIKDAMDDLVEDGKSKWEAFWEVVTDGKTVIRSIREAFLDFMADFILEISLAIIKQQVLNGLLALGGLFGAGKGSDNPLISGDVLHQGGIAGGAGVPRRLVDADIFKGAQRFHEGGYVGLRNNEVPAILQRGEEVLRQDDPRHSANGGADAGERFRILNLFNTQEAFEAAVNSPEGERIILNRIAQNPAKYKRAMGVG